MCLALALCLAPGWSRAESVGPPAPEAAADGLVRPPAQLRIDSQGASHFEIENKAVVADYTGGVHATYLGYALSCDELRLNQQSQLASLRGNIEVTGPGMALSATQVELGLDAGTVKITGGLSGSLSEHNMAFAAGSAELKLIDPKASASLTNVSASLTGNVILTDAQGSQLSAGSAEYDGTTSTLRVPGQFVAVLSSEEQGARRAAKPAAVPHAKNGRAGRSATLAEGIDLSGPLHFAGAGLTAKLGAGGALERATIAQPRLSVGSARLFAANADVVPVGDARQTQTYALRLSGDPVACELASGGKQYQLSAQEVACQLARQQTQGLTLRGQVHVSGGGLVAETEEMALAQADSGQFTLTFPRGLHASGNLAALSGAPVHTLDQLRLKTK